MKQRHGETRFLDGLRGIAALAVVFSHLLFWYYPEAHIGLKAAAPAPFALWLFNSPFSFFYKGGYAVSVFFVLSGFVLTAVCLRKQDDLYLAQAVVKRYLRLGGPVFASVVLCAIMQAFGAFDAAKLGIHVPLSGAYTAALEWPQVLRSALYGSMIYGDRTYDYVLWTISIEFYGSLLIFASAALFGFDKGLMRWASAVLFLLFFLQMGQFTYYSMFFAGAYLAALEPQKHPVTAGRRATSTLALIGALYLGGYAPASTAYFYLGHTANDLQVRGILTLNWPIAFSGIGATLLVYAVLTLPSIKRWLSTPVLTWLGGVSFSLYLLHSLVLTAITPWIMHWMGFGATSFFSSLVTILFASLAVAYLFWLMIDLRFMQLADRFGGKATKCALLSHIETRPLDYRKI